MSISAALSSALSGLTASSRMAQVTSSNVANAMTEGYGRREVSLSAKSLGGTGVGVEIDGVTRQVNETVIQDRRLADAEAGHASLLSTFYNDMEAMVGNPEDPTSLSAKMANFDAALIEASSSPDSSVRLASVVTSANNITSHINDASQQINAARLTADSTIASEVERLNMTLQQVDDINEQILRQAASGNDSSALLDKRQVLIDQVAEFVPIKTYVRDNDQLAIYTTSGAMLLDGTVAEIGFEAAGQMAPHFSVANGQLSTLTLNGEAVSSGDRGLFGGGSLGALFEIRDTLAPAAQEQLDAVARDLITRFEDSSVDSTWTVGAAGFFTDAGSAFDATLEQGLASRISVNSAVDPKDGGDLWRLRDGIYATSQGAVGNSAMLTSMSEAMSEALAPASGDFGSTVRSAFGLVSDLVSGFSTKRQSAELVESYATAKQSTLTQTELSYGVDTDQELQALLLIEQSYAANARVMQTLDSLIQRLLEI
ncbi:flagellar hook-associated protein FlgK [Thioclava sp. SK-1]|uniref:flagellar hook-associated protein FlgK n=1 Tax=Thioclava sp. SK-1 TaxID=1889770 RepID=UPI0008269A1A|nr:flagellar hook-associated protein FlgK [Thioclava sp. SK-1]OCX65284.1 flagellar hook-associated protein FlgK [Thioclava sp. SK-1]